MGGRGAERNNNDNGAPDKIDLRIIIEFFLFLIAFASCTDGKHILTVKELETPFCKVQFYQ